MLAPIILNDSNKHNLPTWFSYPSSSLLIDESAVSSAIKVGLNVGRGSGATLRAMDSKPPKDNKRTAAHRDVSAIGHHFDTHASPIGITETPANMSPVLPKKVRIDASTICRLKCEGCGFQCNGCPELGAGYLTANNFRF